MHFWDGDWHMGWMAIWWFLGAAVIAAIVWAAVKFARGPGSPADSPEAILKRRYAKGEIDQQTYERMLGELRR
jgi:putative membrane protein